MQELKKTPRRFKKFPEYLFRFVDMDKITKILFFLCVISLSVNGYPSNVVKREGNHRDYIIAYHML